MSLPQVEVVSKMLAGLKSNVVLEMVGIDGTFQLQSQEGSVLAKAEAQGVFEPLTELKIGNQSWLTVKCNIKEENYGPVQATSVENWQIINDENQEVLGICDFNSWSDQLLHFGDWFKSEVFDLSGKSIGQIKGQFRFCRMLPFFKNLFEKRFRVYYQGRLLAVVKEKPQFWARLNPFRVGVLPSLQSISFQENLTEKDRL